MPWDIINLQNWSIDETFGEKSHLFLTLGCGQHSIFRLTNTSGFLPSFPPAALHILSAIQSVQRVPVKAWHRPYKLYYHVAICCTMVTWYVLPNDIAQLPDSLLTCVCEHYITASTNILLITLAHKGVAFGNASAMNTRVWAAVSEHYNNLKNTFTTWCIIHWPIAIR